MELREVAIAYRAGDAEVYRLAEACGRELSALGAKVLLGPSGREDNPYPFFLESLRHIDVVLVLGGDGSTLGAARHLAPLGVPILAVNIGGHLGFLTQPRELFADTQAVWRRLQENRFAIERRMMLQAQVVAVDARSGYPVGCAIASFLALNEMCVKPSGPDRLATAALELEIDGEPIDQCHGDGLIVATPTGSTSYMVAAGGPIVHPGMEALTIAPICPLSLSSRPIVLPPRLTVSIWPLDPEDRSLKLWADGTLARTVLPGQRVDIRMAYCTASFVILRENYSFYQSLREKLLWRGTRIPYDNPYRVQ